MGPTKHKMRMMSLNNNEIRKDDILFRTNKKKITIHKMGWREYKILTMIHSSCETN